jgi:chaperone modulatory protein CbpM
MARNHEATSVELIDEHTTFTLLELCQTCSVEAEIIEAMMDYGILEPVGGSGGNLRFPASSLRRTRITIHLQRDLGINLAGAALALELLERIDELDEKLRIFGGPEGD